MSNQKVQCEICGKLFSKCGIQQHRQWHANEERRKKEKELRPVPGFLELRDDLFCQYCGKQWKNLNALKQHEARCKENPSKILSGSMTHKGPRVLSEESRRRMGWAKGLTKETDERIKHHSEALKGRPANSPGRCYDDEDEAKRRAKISASMKAIGAGGYVPGSGRGQKGSYKGVFCDSSWELAYVIYNIDHNITFRKNFDSFPYIYKREVHQYTPDFYQGGYYIEIKGYGWNLDKYKYRALRNIKVLREAEMKKYLDYVISTYGSDYVRLYE